MAGRLSHPRREPAAEFRGLDGHAGQLLLDPAPRLVVDALRVPADDSDEVPELYRGVRVRGPPDLVCELVGRLDHVRSQCLYVRGARGVLEATVEMGHARYLRSHGGNRVGALRVDGYIRISATCQED